jgi:hypothetical protein
MENATKKKYVNVMLCSMDLIAVISYALTIVMTEDIALMEFVIVKMVIQDQIVNI